MKNKRIVSYAEYGIMAEELAAKVKIFEPNIIFGIPRGGWPIAVHIQHRVKADLVGDVGNLVEYIYTTATSDPMKIAVVDDIYDTGSTFVNTMSLLQSRFSYFIYKSSICVEFFTLFYSDSEKYRYGDIPFHYVRESSKNEWIVFPWETIEEPMAVDNTLKIK